MKRNLRGRHLGVALEGACETAARELEQRGFTTPRALDLAEAACKYAQEETETLTRLLTPRDVWGGTVVMRQHYSAQKEHTWLMLKYTTQGGWHLDSALFN